MGFLHTLHCQTPEICEFHISATSCPTNMQQYVTKICKSHSSGIAINAEVPVWIGSRMNRGEMCKRWHFMAAYFLWWSLYFTLCSYMKYRLRTKNGTYTSRHFMQTAGSVFHVESVFCFYICEKTLRSNMRNFLAWQSMPPSLVHFTSYIIQHSYVIFPACLTCT